jgi:hypothetical protein
MNYGDESPKNIYEWLEMLRLRPLMFLGTAENPITKLESMIHAYYMALESHWIHEDVPSLDIHFIQWLSTQRKWGWPKGIANVIAENTPDGVSQLDFFFEFVDEYRKLKPTELLIVDLNASHEPTGRRVRIGGEQKNIRRPDRLGIVQYKPKWLHHLRFYYGERIQDDSFLWKQKGKISLSTTIEDAKKWALDEFNIHDDEWQQPT